MAKYREKETGKIIKAAHYQIETIMDVIKLVTERQNLLFVAQRDYPQIEVLTMNGLIKADYGDWIIRFDASRLLVSSPDIFEKAFEKIEESKDEI